MLPLPLETLRNAPVLNPSNIETLASSQQPEFLLSGLTFYSPFLPSLPFSCPSYPSLLIFLHFSQLISQIQLGVRERSRLPQRGPRPRGAATAAILMHLQLSKRISQQKSQWWWLNPLTPLFLTWMNSPLLCPLIVLASAVMYSYGIICTHSSKQYNIQLFVWFYIKPWKFF